MTIDSGTRYMHDEIYDATCCWWQLIWWQSWGGPDNDAKYLLLVTVDMMTMVSGTRYMMKLVTTEVAVITLVWVEWSMCSMSSIRVNLKFNTTTKYGFEWISVKGIQENINPTWHKLFFGGLDMGGGSRSPPPGKHPSGTFMSSNDLVTHQAHKNGQF